MSNFKTGFKNYDLVSISEEHREMYKNVGFGFKKKCKDIAFGFKNNSTEEHVTISFESFASFESFVVGYYDESPYTLNTNLVKHVATILKLVYGKTSEMTLSDFVVYFGNRFIDKAIKLNIATESKEYDVYLLKSSNCSPTTASEIMFTIYGADNSHWRDTVSKMETALGVHELVAIVKEGEEVTTYSAQEFLEKLKL